MTRHAPRTVNVKAIWDDEAKVYVATSEDVPGLVTEAEKLDDLLEKLRIMIPELFELNGFEPPLREMPVSLTTPFQANFC